MRRWFFLAAAAGCQAAATAPEPTMKPTPTPATVVEAPAPAAPAPADPDLKFDLVVAETAVGSYAGVSFTVAGLATKQVGGKPVLTTYLDIAKTRFVDVVEGTVFELKPGVTLEVVRIAKPDGEKGKLWFREVPKAP